MRMPSAPGGAWIRWHSSARSISWTDTTADDRGAWGLIEGEYRTRAPLATNDLTIPRRRRDARAPDDDRAAPKNTSHSRVALLCVGICGAPLSDHLAADALRHLRNQRRVGDDDRHRVHG